MEIAYHAAIEMKTGMLFYSLISVSFVRNVFSKGKKAKFYNSIFKIATKLTIIRKFGGFFFQYRLGF